MIPLDEMGYRKIIINCCYTCEYSEFDFLEEPEGTCKHPRLTEEDHSGVYINRICDEYKNKEEKHELW